MSFANDVKNELLDAQIKKNCCKKAFLIGLLINARHIDKNSFEVEYYGEETANKAKSLLETIYRATPTLSLVNKPGKLYYKLTFTSSSFAELIGSIDLDPDVSISEAISFKCTSCEQLFLRGVFISTGKLNDPQKGYALEFSLSKQNLSRASKLYRFMSLLGFVAKIINRANTSGLYFKSNQTISDILYFLGAIGPSFDYENSSIEKDIINKENRATNCVASNILKSVNTAQKHANAINKLIESHKFDSLPEELKITAKIRIENLEATLSELAALHNPPISKSGLNHRLDKLIREAEVLDD